MIVMVCEQLTVVARDFHSPLVRNEIWVSFGYWWPRLFDLPQPAVGIHAQRNEINYLVELASWRAIGEQFNARVREDLVVLRSALETSEVWGQELNAYTERSFARADLTGLAGDELVRRYQQYVRLQAREYAVGVLLPLLDLIGGSFIDEFLRRYLAARLPPAAAAEAYEVFTMPSKNSFALDQEEALLQLAVACRRTAGCWKLLGEADYHDIPAQLHRQFPDLAERLIRHADAHGWVYYVYQGPAFSAIHFAQFLQGWVCKDVDPQAELARRRTEREELLQQRAELLATLGPSAEERALLLLVSDFVWAKPRRKDYQSRSYWHAESFFREWARRTETSLRHARAATQEQLQRGCQGEKIVLGDLEQQYAEHLVYGGPQRVVVLSGAAVAPFLKEQVIFPEERVAVTGRVTGTTAFPGQARGEVRIVNKPEDIANMRVGDVLVSIATTPSIVPAMRQASAIVSDEGGLTCHAAIVSRELRIPCVVGTKIATQVLKDGDEVKVDADAGVVRVLKRAGG